MDEDLGQAMLRTRMQVLEELAIDYLRTVFSKAGVLRTPEELRQLIEKEIEKRAPGCGRVK